MFYLCEADRLSTAGTTRGGATRLCILLLYDFSALLNGQCRRVGNRLGDFVVAFLIGDINSIPTVKNLQLGIFFKEFHHLLAVGFTFGTNQLHSFIKCDLHGRNTLWQRYEFSVMLDIRTETTYGNAHIGILEFAQRAGKFKEFQRILKCDVEY